ncbi:MAG: tetratricopeptide repeat protein [Bacteriovoracales bacterium]|nr:tetratricopeptide repeat protein [Bacteriovoracales bacterium]
MLKRIFLLFCVAGLSALVVGGFYLSKDTSIKEIELAETVEKMGLHKVFDLIDNIDTSNLAKSFEEFKKEVIKTNRYESMALHLRKENRELKVKLGRFESQVSELETQNKFLLSRFRDSKTSISRRPASLKLPIDKKNDLVKFSTYKWKDRQLLNIARNEWERKNYIKSAQFFHTLIHAYPKSPLLSDIVLFEAAMVSFQSKRYTVRAEKALNRIIKEFPDSRYYRGAKLWAALSHFDKGNEKKFYQTLEEFRLKYRNTSEWKILSRYYEKSNFSQRI